MDDLPHTPLRIAPDKFAWSHSKLNVYENCPYQFYREHVAKDIPWTDTDSGLWGSAVHFMYEQRLLRAKEPWSQQLGQTMIDYATRKYAKDKKVSHVAAAAKLKEVLDVWPERYERWAVFIINLGGKLIIEEKLAVSREILYDNEGNPYFRPTKYFAPDVFFRATGDAFSIQPPNAEGVVHGVLWDHKTGKLYDKRGNDKHDPDQAAVNAMCLFSYFPSVHVIDTVFCYTDEKKGPEVRRDRFTRKEMVRMLSPIQPKIAGIIECNNRGQWPHSPSGLCRGWCSVTDCVHFEPKK